MADLVVALRNAADAKQLGGLFAKALHDPSLVLGYWLPGLDTYVDSDGQPVALPAPGRGTTVIAQMPCDPASPDAHDAVRFPHPRWRQRT